VRIRSDHGGMSGILINSQLAYQVNTGVTFDCRLGGSNRD